MPILWSLLTLAGVHLLAVASPGPAFVSVIQTSVRNPRRVTLCHVLGLGLASALWACSAIFGLEALLVRFANLYRILQLAGGLYLAWIGIQAWRHARSPLPLPSERAAALTPAQAIRRGFSTNIANPKVMVFYGSIFTALLHPGMPAWVRPTAIGITIFNNVAWYGSLGLLLSSSKAQATYTHAKSTIDRIAGTVMFLFGLKLIWGARHPA
jgi:threonine efflux protein